MYRNRTGRTVIVRPENGRGARRSRCLDAEMRLRRLLHPGTVEGAITADGIYKTVKYYATRIEGSLYSEL